MILLYVVLTNMKSVDRQLAVQAVEKSLEIFNAMNMVGVARRCAEITHDVLEMAKKSTIETGERSEQNEPTTTTTTLATLTGMLAQNSGAEFYDFDLSKEDLFASLVDPNIMDGFAGFDSGYFEIPDFNSVLASGSIS
jgi:hypothetical protein